MTVLDIVVITQIAINVFLVLWLYRNGIRIGDNREYICREMLKNLPLPIGLDTKLTTDMDVKYPVGNWTPVDSWRGMTAFEAMTQACTYDRVSFRYRRFPATETCLSVAPLEANTCPKCGNLIPKSEEFLVCKHCFDKAWENA